jgi:hypothetical protein
VQEYEFEIPILTTEKAEETVNGGSAIPVKASFITTETRRKVEES